MAFTELNSVEHFIIHELSGVNLNREMSKSREEPERYTQQWKYRSAEQLKRGVNEVIEEEDLRKASGRRRTATTSLRIENPVRIGIGVI